MQRHTMLNNIVYSNCTKKDQTLNQTNIEIPLNKKQENLKKNGGNLSSNEKKFKKKKIWCKFWFKMNLQSKY